MISILPSWRGSTANKNIVPADQSIEINVLLSYDTGAISRSLLLCHLNKGYCRKKKCCFPGGLQRVCTAGKFRLICEATVPHLSTISLSATGKESKMMGRNVS